MAFPSPGVSGEGACPDGLGGIVAVLPAPVAWLCLDSLLPALPLSLDFVFLAAAVKVWVFRVLCREGTGEAGSGRSSAEGLGSLSWDT